MVGTDAEVFLRNVSNQKPVPVIGLLGGTKLNPRQLNGFEKGFAVQEDNVMAEFNIPPADNAKEFSDSIHKVLAYLRYTMREKELDLEIKGSLHFNMNDLRHPQAQTFGCDPDICAWTGEYNEIDKKNPLLLTMRSAAAHIHVSYLVDGIKPTGYNERALAVKAHELFVGVPGILLDSDTERRTIYGKAGAFRLTDYGHEYRTPSNFWIKSDTLRYWTFKQTIKALQFINHAKNVDLLENNEEIGNMIQDAINNHDEIKADFLCQEFQIEVPQSEISI